MTPAQIRKKSEEFRKKIKALEQQIEHVRVDWQALEDECEHPNEYKTSCMGDPGTHCPDCGRST